MLNRRDALSATGTTVKLCCEDFSFCSCCFTACSCTQKRCLHSSGRAHFLCLVSRQIYRMESIELLPFFFFSLLSHLYLSLSLTTRSPVSLSVALSLSLFQGVLAPAAGHSPCLKVDAARPECTEHVHSVASMCVSVVAENASTSCSKMPKRGDGIPDQRSVCYPQSAARKGSVAVSHRLTQHKNLHAARASVQYASAAGTGMLSLICSNPTMTG